MLLEATLKARNNLRCIIIHSDQGSVYTSHAFQNFVQERKLQASMSRRGTVGVTRSWNHFILI